MIRIYKILTVLMISWAFLSCVDENDPVNTDINNSKSGNLFSFSFNIPFGEGDLTRSDSIDIGEVLIKGVRIVLYDEFNPFIHYSWDLDIQVDYDTNSSSFTASGSDLKSFEFDGSVLSLSVQSTARKIIRNNYRMLIIINPNDKIVGLTNTDNTLNDLNDPFDTMDENSMYQIWGDQNGKGGVPGYFLMLNSQGLIKITTGNLWQTAELAEKNPVYAKVERVAAKINCTHTGSGNLNGKSVLNAGDGRFVMHLGYDISGDYDLPDWVTDCIYNSGTWACGGTYDRTTKICNECGRKYGFGLGNYTDIPRYIVATDLIWQVDIINKKSYWYRQAALKADGSMEVYGNTDIQNFYAKDPNFSNLSGTPGLNNEFFYKTNISYTDGKKDSYRRLTPSSYTYSPYWSWTEGDSDPVYIPENTMDTEDQKGDVVSRIIIKATLKRERLDTPANTFQIGDFFLFKGGVEGNNIYNMNNIDANGNYFYLLPPEHVVEYKNGTTPTPVNLRGGDVSLASAIAQFSAENPGFNWDNISANTEPAISDYLVFYKNGEMYYEVPIKHFSNNEVGGYGRFGVVRNRGYIVDILDVLSLGTPTIPTPRTNLIETKSTKSVSTTERGTYNNNSFQRSYQVIL